MFAGFIPIFRRVAWYSAGACLLLSGTMAQAGNPIPFVSQPLVPGAVVPGGPGFTLTVNGATFVSGATVKWNGSPRTTTFVSSSQLTASILASDIANQGSAQITVANPGSLSSTPALFLIAVPGTGAGFSFTEDFSTAFPVAPVAGDFNGDGKPDLVVSDITPGDYEKTYTVLLGKGDGTFKTLSPVNVSGITHLQLLLALDLNGDGKLDLFGVDTEDSVNGAISTGVVMLGNGDGTFQAPETFLLGGSPVDNFVAADFNKDGKLDLATTVLVGDSAQVSVFLGNGNGKHFKIRLVSPEGAVWQLAISMATVFSICWLGMRCFWATGMEPFAPANSSPGTGVS